jgi:hypothetical protein
MTDPMVAPPPHQRGRLFYIVATLANAISSAALVVLGILGAMAAKHALDLTERAWVAPAGPIFRPEKPPPAAPLEKDRPIHFIVNLFNSGKEPALSVAYKISNYTVDSYDPVRSSMDDIVLPVNSTCDGLEPKGGRPSFPPSAVSSMTMDSMHAESPLTVDDRILNGSRFYAVQGCVAYLTLERVHRTGFCYVLEYIPSSKNPPAFSVCAQGFYID